MKTKQVIIMKKFPSLRTGKYCAQAAHASLGAFLNCYTLMETNPDVEQHLNDWLYDSFTKVVLYVDTDEELVSLYEQCIKEGIPSALITDNGTTEFNGVPTTTALGIGPWIIEDIDKITGELKLF